MIDFKLVARPLFVPAFQPASTLKLSSLALFQNTLPLHMNPVPLGPSFFVVPNHTCNLFQNVFASYFHILGQVRVSGYLGVFV